MNIHFLHLRDDFSSQIIRADTIEHIFLIQQPSNSQQSLEKVIYSIVIQFLYSTTDSSVSRPQQLALSFAREDYRDNYFLKILQVLTSKGLLTSIE